MARRKKLKEQEIEQTLFKAVEVAQRQGRPLAEIQARMEELHYTLGSEEATEFLELQGKFADLALKYQNLKLRGENAKSLVA